MMRVAFMDHTRALEGVGNCGCGGKCADCGGGHTNGLGILSFIIDAATAKDGKPGVITGTVFGLWDKISGAEGQEKARQDALRAQQVAAQQSALQADQRAATIQAVAPWVALGVGVLGVAVVLGVVASKR